ncbi:hypothetical protein QYE76_018063 [Lolium multiflorum]|uniref:Uncharacterized protein n=1 Tax=Lolium multiflorum TaxID=4521 RepID=A0AAD8QDX8_LOLMU|nr:hypothetical protein QYE76_018063 [Lolium multiflorum]
MLETVTVTLKMDSTVLHCIFCSQPLKPPVFKCKGNHLACGRCLSELPGNRCHRCVEPRGFEHDPAMDAVVSAATVECPHSSCGSLVAYHQHSIQVHKLPPYNTTKVFEVLVPGSPCLRIIAEGEDGAVFVLIIGVLGSTSTTIVSTVCVRAAACVWPLYTAKMWANGPASCSLAHSRSRADTVNVSLEASSCALPGDVAFDELTSFLSVPPLQVLGGPSKLLRFYIRIEKENN